MVNDVHFYYQQHLKIEKFLHSKIKCIDSKTINILRQKSNIKLFANAHYRLEVEKGQLFNPTFSKYITTIIISRNILPAETTNYLSLAD